MCTPLLIPSFHTNKKVVVSSSSLHQAFSLMRAQKTKAVTLLPSNVFSSQCLLCGRLHSLAWKDIIAPLLLTQLFQQSVSTISCYTLLMPFDVSGTSVNQRGRQKRALEIDALYTSTITSLASRLEWK